MTDIQPENRGFYWATVFLRALWQSGMHHLVISPGSRSTPLTLAAAVLPHMQTHVVLDERSAAFMALGIGKATNQPAALICTSGTAVANYFPCVIEARKSSVPLLLLTADRPPHLRHTGANQTINQQHIFGDYPVFFHEVGEPVVSENDFAYLARLARQAHRHAIHRQGPAHLNFPFRKPMTPDRHFVHAISLENKNLSKKSCDNTPENKKFGLRREILTKIRAADRPLFIIGQLSPAVCSHPVFLLAKQLQAPVLSECGISDPNYGILGFEGFLRSENVCRKLEPDLILRFGLQPAAKSLLQAIKKWRPSSHIYFSDSGNCSDIEHFITDFIDWNGHHFNTNNFPKKSDEWLEIWKQTEARYIKELAAILAAQQSLTDGHVYHHLVADIPEHWTISISNSFPARDQSMFGQWKTQKIFTNRGASGIDGTTSTAIGVNIGRDQPGILFTGDLAFLHDTNGLLNHQELSQPLVIVVINNRGGSIFRMLPVARHQDYFRPYFETPQKADITGLVQNYGIGATKIETLDELKKLDFDAIASESKSMLHVIECRTDAEASVQVRNTLWRINNEN